MRRAMADAEVGDDVFQGDPTVRLLEEETAALLGKEAALFVPSGCMGNEIAVAIQTRPGDAILLERFSHLVMVEAAAITQLMGRRFEFVDGERGRLRAEDVARGAGGTAGTIDAATGATNGGASAVSGKGISLVEVENTFNWTNGAIYPLPQLEGVAGAARARGWRIHLDGARLWNASAATGIPPATYAAAADTVMTCFSKGLGAPVGSAIAGTAAAVQEARGVRKMLGGGMRQVGIIAAGALHGLRHHRQLLPEDHRRARRLADAIAETPGLRIDPKEVETNIVIASIEGSHDRLPAFIAALKDEGILVLPYGGPGRFRAVTHFDVDDAGIERAIGAIRRVAASALGVGA